MTEYIHKIKSKFSEIIFRQIFTETEEQNATYIALPGQELYFFNPYSKIIDNGIEILLFDLNEVTDISKIFNKISVNGKKKHLLLNGLNAKNKTELIKLSEELSKKYPQQISIVFIASTEIYDELDQLKKNHPTFFSKILPMPLIDLENINPVFEDYDLKPDEIGEIKIALLRFSGGFFELAEYCFSEIVNDRQKIKFPYRLLRNKNIEIIIKNLSKVLLKFDVNDLVKFNILNRNGTLFSRLLEVYLDNYTSSDLTELFPNLSKSDIKLLTIFVRNRKTIIDKNNIQLFVNKSFEKAIDWATYKAVERMKNKLKGIITIEKIKGKGWKIQ